LNANHKKNKVEDLKKAEFYLRYYIEYLEGKFDYDFFVKKLHERMT